MFGLNLTQSTGNITGQGTIYSLIWLSQMYNASVFVITQIHLIVYESRSTRLPQPYQAYPDSVSTYTEVTTEMMGSSSITKEGAKRKDK